MKKDKLIKTIAEAYRAFDELLANMADSGADTNDETGEQYADIIKAEKAITKLGRLIGIKRT